MLGYGYGSTIPQPTICTIIRRMLGTESRSMVVSGFSVAVTPSVPSHQTDASKRRQTPHPHSALCIPAAAEPLESNQDRPVTLWSPARHPRPGFQARTPRARGLATLNSIPHGTQQWTAQLAHNSAQHGFDDGCPNIYASAQVLFPPWTSSQFTVALKRD